MLMLRALIFYIIFGFTALIVGPIGALLFFTPYRFRSHWVFNFNRIIMWALGWVCGVKINVVGSEHIQQDQPVVVISKHQSTWETLFLQPLFSPASTILKKELLRIPFFGWGLAQLKPIAIDRSNPKEALKTVKVMGKKRLEEGNNLIIFPEGTRTPVGEVGNYARSGADIAISAGAKIVPVAHNGGVHWPMHTICKFPGTIEVLIGAPIETQGKNSKQLTAEVKDWIEAEVAKMPQQP